ncbi:MAG TPA: lysophospholipid acyltransferase family protein [Candidatus Dormibacteraeota bacterium]
MEPERYRGPDYLAAISGGLPPEPLLHADPQIPSRAYRVLVWLLKHVLPLLFRVEVTGLENLPPPPYIVASNHQKWLDPLFIALALPSRPMVYSMARRDTVFNRRWKRWLVPRLGAFPISPNQGHLDEQGLATVYRVLDRGGVVLIFPEGRYSRGRRLRPLREGVAHFALQSGVPVVPIALEGVDRLRLRGRVRVSVGRPVYPDPPSWWSLQRRVTRTVDSVRRAILRTFGREPERRPGRLRRWLGRFRTSRRGRSPS